jgi:hypothetical protein
MQTLTRRVTVVACLLWLVLSGVAAAQPQESAPPATREEVWRRARAAKARQTEPYKPGTIEKWIDKVENDRMIEDMLTTSSGFYIQFGNITTGAGLGAGPGYKRKALFGGRMDVKAFTVASMKRYWVAQGSVTFPRLAGSRSFVELFGRRRDFPQEDFFGLGPHSLRPNFVSFTYRDAAFGGTAGYYAAPILLVSSTVERVSPSVGRGRDPRIPSIDALFTEADAPGYAVPSDFMRYEAKADFNYATPLGNPRSGGRYMLTVVRYNDLEQNRFNFKRLDVDLRQYLSFLKQRRVIALRGLMSLSDADPGNDVPFYLQETLGGHNTLRGFHNYRFRDRNLLLLQAEYRWEIFPALDAALFYDAGQVSPTRRGLALKAHDYGFGFRFGTIQGVFLRIDSAFGSPEGKHFFIKFGNVF